MHQHLLPSQELACRQGVRAEWQDLPKIVKNKAARIWAAWDREEDTSDSHDEVFLDKFFYVHSVETRDVAAIYAATIFSDKSSAVGPSKATSMKG